MNPLRIPSSALGVLACFAIAATATTQGFSFGAMYLLGAYQVAPGGIAYPGLAHVDPVTGVTTPFAQFSTGVYPASATYDPFRDRIVVYGGTGTMVNPAVIGIDANGATTVIANTYLVRLAARGDGKIYGVKAGASHPTVQEVYYLDAAGVEHVLLDVGGAAPWRSNGGVPFNSSDPVRAMIYEPAENALFLAFAGDNLTPDCGAPSFDVSLRKLPLTGDGTALRAPAVCSEYDVAGLANVSETPLSLGYGPAGSLAMTVFTTAFGAMPRVLGIDPVSAQMTPLVTVGPYTGDIAVSAGAYSPLTDRVLVLDGGNDVWRAFVPGGAGAGQILASYGSTGLGSGTDQLFAIAPIGPAWSLTADTTQLSVGSGGAQHLDFHPGPSVGGNLYLILGSLSGWAPGFPFTGVQVPLNLDWYTQFTLGAANSPFFVTTLGVLPPGGTTTASIVFPPQVLGGLVGQTMHHAAIAFDGSLQIRHASNPMPLQLLP